jgi:hypothetical protein
LIKVLTCNHVVELLQRRGAGESWADALAHTMPGRKDASDAADGEKLRPYNKEAAMVGKKQRPPKEGADPTFCRDMRNL